MKNLFCTLVTVALLSGCKKPASSTATEQRWEYKVVEVKNFAGYMKTAAYQEMTTNAPNWEDHERAADSGAGDFHLDSNSQMGEYGADMYQLGADGWELVSAVPQIETIPDAKSFHGQDFDASTGKLVDGYTHFTNTRTGKIILIFKRPK